MIRSASPRTWLALIVCSACVSFAVPARAQSVADIARYSGPDRTQHLVDGAKKEGLVTIYSSAVIADTNAIIQAFEKKYGVRVRLWRGSSDDILRRAVTEARGERYDADLAETAGDSMEGLQRERLLAEISSPVFAQLMPGAVIPHRGWIADRLSVFTVAYNTTLIKPADVPKNYADLADPKWKGKLGVDDEADDSSWFMSVAEAMGKDAGLALFRKIVATNGISVRRGHTLLSNLVVAGEVPLALNVYGYRVTALKKERSADRRRRTAAGLRAADRYRSSGQGAASERCALVARFLSDGRSAYSRRARQCADQPNRHRAATGCEPDRQRQVPR